MGPFRNGWTQADIDAVIARDDADDVLHAPIVVSLDPPDCAWAQDICLRLSAHRDARVRANAILGFGHLARTCGALDEARVRPLVLAALRDADDDVRGQAHAAASDIAHFLGWAGIDPGD